MCFHFFIEVIMSQPLSCPLRGVVVFHIVLLHFQPHHSPHIIINHVVQVFLNIAEYSASHCYLELHEHSFPKGEIFASAAQTPFNFLRSGKNWNLCPLNIGRSERGSRPRTYFMAIVVPPLNCDTILRSGLSLRQWPTCANTRGWTLKRVTRTWTLWYECNILVCWRIHLRACEVL